MGLPAPQQPLDSAAGVQRAFTLAGPLLSAVVTNATAIYVRRPGSARKFKAEVVCDGKVGKNGEQTRIVPFIDRFSACSTPQPASQVRKSSHSNTASQFVPWQREWLCRCVTWRC
jgi:hypothetical protein